MRQRVNPLRQIPKIRHHKMLIHEFMLVSKDLVVLFVLVEGRSCRRQVDLGVSLFGLWSVGPAPGFQVTVRLHHPQCKVL